jgi:hypothetical protein
MGAARIGFETRGRIAGRLNGKEFDGSVLDGLAGRRVIRGVGGTY